MGSKHKQTQTERKAYFERKLDDRRSFLNDKGMESATIEKDSLVKQLRAKVRAVNARLQTIVGYEEKTEELTKKKAEKAAAPSKGKEPAKAPEEGKAPKKKKKKTGETAKEK